MLGTILIVILILMLLGALTARPDSSDSEYFPGNVLQLWRRF